VPAAVGQYAEVPRPLPVPVSSFFGGFGGGVYTGAVQIGRRLIVSGVFTRLAPPGGGAAVATPSGAAVPGAFPLIAGAVRQIVLDGAGGWLVIGDFASVAGQPIAGFVRVAPDRTVDTRFRVVADGPIHRIAIGHGRVYLAGAFTSINGTTRRGLAALDAASGQLTPWAAGFNPGGALNQLSVSSIGVYVAGGGGYGHLWGLDAGSGRVLFDRPGWVSAVAASSQRVYVGQVGFQRPLWAVDPLTGADTDWGPGLTFEYIPVTYGQDATQITSLLLDGARLYVGGRFRTSDGRTSLAAVNADGGALDWRPATPGPQGSPEVALFRIGPAIAASFAGGFAAYDVGSAARLPFTPDVAGSIVAIAPAPEGVVLGGSFTASGGVARDGLAALDLDTFEVEPWTSNVAIGPGRVFSQLATDGTWLFGVVEGDLGGTDARVLKIDAATGAVAGERTFPSVVTHLRMAGGRVFVSTLPRNTLAGELGTIAIADWSYTPLPVTLDGWITSLDASGDSLYLAGRFTTVSGASRPSFAAVHPATGALLPWHPAAPVETSSPIVRAANARVWIGGDFRRVAGQRRRGLAEVDPATGAPLPWNPDIAGVLSGNAAFGGVANVEIGPDGHIYVGIGGAIPPDPFAGVAAGQLVPALVVYSGTSGERLPWRPATLGLAAVLPDCLLTSGGCLLPAVPAPTHLQVTQSGAAVRLDWTLPPSPARSGVRLEVGSVEGRADLLTLDLPADQTTFSAAAPAGSYFARVRALAGLATSLSTSDVSMAVGPPDVPGAPLDLSALVAGATTTFAWRPPTTGAPPIYQLEVGTTQGGRDIGTASIGGAATSVTLAVPATASWARLVAVNAQGRSAPSRDVFLPLTPLQTCSTSPPLNLAATVSGRIVTFTWDPPADGSDAPPRLVAGTASGAANIGALTMPAYATSFSIAAPPGTYYVRLQVGCFTMAYSNEVQVVVP
jgi:hypothetical protein